MRTMRVHVMSPGWVETFEDVLHVRIEAADGARGFQAGHEPALAQLAPGPVALSFGDGASRVLATEGGLAKMERGGLRLVTPWATEASDLGALSDAVRLRGEQRRAAEDEARAVALRHEKAAQRALVALRRGGPP